MRGPFLLRATPPFRRGDLERRAAGIAQHERSAHGSQKSIGAVRERDVALLGGPDRGLAHPGELGQSGALHACVFDGLPEGCRELRVCHGRESIGLAKYFKRNPLRTEKHCD